MASINREVMFSCEDSWCEDNSILNNKLGDLITQLFEQTVRDNFNKVEPIKLLHQILSLRVRHFNNNGQSKNLLSSCKCFIENTVLFTDSAKSKNFNSRQSLYGILEKCLELLLIAEENAFCLDFIESLKKRLSLQGDCGVERNDYVIVFLGSTLNALLGFKQRFNLLINKQIIDSLNNTSVFVMLSHLVFNSENLNHPTYILCTITPKVVKITEMYTIISFLWRDMNCHDVSINMKSFVLCALADFFTLVHENYSNTPITTNEFWKIVQETLLSEDALVRKRGLYMLKRSIDAVRILNLDLNLTLFTWNCVESNLSQELWGKIFLTFEVLEEKQAHLVIPAVQSVITLVAGFKYIHPSWLVTIFCRLLSHDSLQVVKLGINNFLQLKIDYYFDCCFEPVIDVLFSKLNNMLLFSGDPISNQWPEIDDALNSWFKHIVLCSDKSERLFSIIIDAIIKVKWCTIPLFHVLYSMSHLPGISLFNEAQLTSLSIFLKEMIKTQIVFIRGAIQCILLNIIVKHSKTTPNLFHVASILNVFRQNECLHRGLNSWKVAKKWIHSCIDAKEETIIKDIFDFQNSLSLETRARCLVLFIDSEKTHCISKIQDAIQSHFYVLKDTYVRPYASKDASNDCIKLIFNVIQESKSTSLDFDIQNDCLIRFLMPYIGQVIPYVQKRMAEVDQEIEFDTIEMYVNTLTAMSSNCLVSLDDGIKLKELAMEVSISSKSHLIKRCFGLKICLWYIRFLVQNKDIPCYLVESIRSYCLVLISNGNLKSSWKERDAPLIRNHKNDYSLLQSWYICDLWSLVQECLQADIISMKEVLSIIPAKDLINVAVNAIESGGRNSLVPILRVMKYFLPCALLNDEDLCKSFLFFTWKSVFELRKLSLFWTCIKEWIEMSFSKKILAAEALLPRLIEFGEQILSDGESVNGMANILLSHISQELTDIQFVKPLLMILTSAMLFGLVPRRDQRIENDTYFLIRRLGSECAVNELIPQSGFRDSEEVRLYALSVLLNVAEQEGGDQLIVAAVNQLLAKDNQLTAKRSRYHGNSQHHRTKHRILQTLLVLETVLAKNLSPIAQSCVRELVKWTSTSLQMESQQPSVRYQLEWLLVRSLHHSPQLISSFWSLFKQASEERTGSVCSFISVAYHLATILKNPSFIDQCVIEILPWCMAQQYNVRLYSQVVLQKLWPLDNEVARKYEAVQRSLSQSLNQGNTLRNTEKLTNDFYFTAFQPLEHFTLETIFWELPRLSNVARDEWVSLSNLQRILGDFQSFVPVSNQDNALKKFTASSWVVKATEAETKMDIGTFAVQKKFVPWKNMFPETEEANESISQTELIVVATLVDKLPNLGGLTRTCEIFAVECLVMASLEFTNDKQFSTLSMTAEKHINIIEVKPYDLPNFLKEKKKSGYTLVGAEQTAASESLNTYSFPKKCLLLLGNEKEGIPVNLLPLLDVCVEVNQLGVVRSLNVHVTGALFIWEYARQHLLNTSIKSNQA